MERNMFEFTLPLEKNTKFLEIIALLYCFLEKSKRQLGTFIQKRRFDFVKLFSPFVFVSAEKTNFAKLVERSCCGKNPRLSGKPTGAEIRRCVSDNLAEETLLSEEKTRKAFF